MTHRDTTRMSDPRKAPGDSRTLLDAVLAHLELDHTKSDEYVCWCPFHRDGQGKPPHRANLNVSLRGYICHACGAKGGLGKLARELGVDVPRPTHPTPRREPDVVYDYCDETGQLLYQACRWQLADGCKDFKQRRPDGRGGWTWNLDGVRRVLYRLPELAVCPGERVWLAEGEKDADALMHRGLLGTTNPMGAGKWHSEYSELLRDREVVILPDNDLPGRKHAQAVAADVHGKARSVKILELPGLAEKGDVCDWFAAGHTKEDLIALAEARAEWAPPVESEIHNTDTGNARRLAAQHRDDIRYCPQQGWLVWDGRRWARDVDNLGLAARAKQTVAGMYAAAASLGDKQAREELAHWALRSESDAKLEAMVRVAKSEPGIPVSVKDLDADIWNLTCANGALDLRSGELGPFRRELLSTKLAPVDYDVTAECPMWLAFLDRIMDRNDDLVSFLQRAVGYSLTGDTSEDCFFLLWGTGSNGKSTFLELVRSVLGDYAAQTPFSTFLATVAMGPRNDLARLAGARLVTAIEADESGRFAEALIKQLAGGDTIACRFLHHEFFEYLPQFKIWLAANHKPRIQGTDHAIWRRVKLVPFTVVIPDAEQDKHLPQKLQAELPGILAWAVQGCLQWQQEGLEEPREVRTATAAYREEQDVLAAFLDECCVLEPTAQVLARDLYRAYDAWCEQNGEKPLSQRRLGGRLTERGLQRGRSTGGRHAWCGIGLLAAE